MTRPEFNKLVNEIWSSINTKVLEGKSLKVLNITPDFTYTKANGNTKLLYVHRKQMTAISIGSTAALVMCGISKQHFAWMAKCLNCGLQKQVKQNHFPYSIANGVTKVKLHMEPNDALFVIFKIRQQPTRLRLPAVNANELATVDGSWNVSFQKDRGAPAAATFDKLASLQKMLTRE